MRSMASSVEAMDNGSFSAAADDEEQHRRATAASATFFGSRFTALERAARGGRLLDVGGVAPSGCRGIEAGSGGVGGESAASGVSIVTGGAHLGRGRRLDRGRVQRGRDVHGRRVERAERRLVERRRARVGQIGRVGRGGEVGGDVRVHRLGDDGLLGRSAACGVSAEGVSSASLSGGNGERSSVAPTGVSGSGRPRRPAPRTAAGRRTRRPACPAECRSRTGRSETPAGGLRDVGGFDLFRGGRLGGRRRVVGRLRGGAPRSVGVSVCGGVGAAARRRGPQPVGWRRPRRRAAPRRDSAGGVADWKVSVSARASPSGLGRRGGRDLSF